MKVSIISLDLADPEEIEDIFKSEVASRELGALPIHKRREATQDKDKFTEAADEQRTSLVDLHSDKVSLSRPPELEKQPRKKKGNKNA